MNVKKEILESIKSLPAISGTTQKIISVSGAEDSDISVVTNLIQYDPVLTSSVLKLVNSAYFGLQIEVASIKQAVLLLGLRKIHRVVVAVSFSPLMNKPIAGYDLSAGDLWRHSVATGVASEVIAKMLAIQDADRIFTAALLHDIGKIALSTFVDEYFSIIEEEAKKSGESFEIIEKKVLGIGHAEAGAILLKSWGIPAALYVPVLWHHNPDAYGVNELSMAVDIVHLADSLCLSGGIGVGRDGLQYRASTNVTERLHIKKIMLERIISQTMTGLDAIKEIFEM